MSRRWIRWMPAAVVPVVIAGVVVAIPLQAGAEPNLPAKTAQQVLTMIANSDTTAFSGTVSQTSSLGLPDLSSASVSGAGASTRASSSDSAASSVLELLSGSHTARVYVDGASKQRVQVLDAMAERDVIRSGRSVWYYDSSTKKATHVTLPAATAKESTTASTETPSTLAEKLLATVSKTSTVSVTNNTKVAGRTAYDLVVTPKTSTTLVDSITVAVDSATGLPLSVEVDAKNQSDPAFSLGYTKLTIGTPAASLFSFTPPADATVTKTTLPTKADITKRVTSAKAKASARKNAPTVTGTGWSSVVELPKSAVPASVSSSPLLDELTTSVTGGRLLHTSLVNVLLTTDGRVFAGSVPVASLQAAATAK